VHQLGKWGAIKSYLSNFIVGERNSDMFPFQFSPIQKVIWTHFGKSTGWYSLNIRNNFYTLDRYLRVKSSVIFRIFQILKIYQLTAGFGTLFDFALSHLIWCAQHCEEWGFAQRTNPSSRSELYHNIKNKVEQFSVFFQISLFSLYARSTSLLM